MALFGKKKTVACAICGKEAKTGFFRGLFQRNVEGQYVCDDCYGVVDLPNEMSANLTMAQFHAYRAFREENQKLKDRFQVSEQVDLDTVDGCFCFDISNRLMCRDRDLKTTIFEANQIKGFAIREDEHTIFQGSPAALVRNESHVPGLLRDMEHMVRFQQMQLRRYREMLNRAPEDKKDEIRQRKPDVRIQEPLRRFFVDIQMEHPYWHTISLELNAPTFSDYDPDMDQYVREYNEAYQKMEALANALTALAFPRAQDVDSSTVAAQNFAAAQNFTAAQAGSDVVTELKRFKELLDMGVITEEEFAAKKRQLMGL